MPHRLSRREILGSGVALALGSAIGRPGEAAPASVPATRIPPDSPDAVWQAFCTALAPLAARVTTGPGAREALDQREGIRCLARLVALGLDRFLEAGDPRFPAFYDLQTATRKYLGDNPDQTYRTAAIDGRGRYRVTGELGGAVAFELGLYAGDFRSDDATPGGGRRLVASLDERDLPVDAEGRFTLTLGPDADAATKGHLRTAPDASSILIRTYFHDRALRLRHAMPAIERLDQADPPEPLDLATLARGLLASTAFVDGSLAFWNGFEGTGRRANHLIAMPDDGSVQTPRRVRYLNGPVELAPDEALLLVFEPKDEPGYWSWVLQNVWGESLDWRHHPIVLNNREIVRGKDGRIEIAVCEARPTRAGLNWLAMAGHRRALLSLRWRGDSPLPDVKTRVVPMASLA